MREEVILEELEIIGATTVAEDLPRRLSPVYRGRGVGERYYLTIAEDGVPRPALSMEPGERFDAMVVDGDAIRFDKAIPALTQHCLIQIEHGVPPEYLPAHDLPGRLFRACREALERASRALSEGKRREAEPLLWYARRASPDDPLPLLALQILLRHEVAAEDLRFLAIDLETYPVSLLEAARRRAHEMGELAAIGELLDEPPLSGARLPYLSDYRSNPSFLTRARSFTAEARRHRRG